MQIHAKARTMQLKIAKQIRRRFQKHPVGIAETCTMQNIVHITIKSVTSATNTVIRRGTVIHTAPAKAKAQNLSDTSNNKRATKVTTVAYK